MRLTLPFPPSANAYWRSVGRRVLLSREARAYKDTVAKLCMVARVRPLLGPVELRLVVYRPRRIGDLSNRIKVLEDALQGHAFEDDSQVVSIHAERRDDAKAPRVEVEVNEVRGGET